MESSDKKTFPKALFVIAVGMWLFGVGIAALVISTRNPSAENTVAQNQPVVERVREGKPAPNFTLKTLAGKTVSLSDLHGKRVLINFWASWCAPCIEEMPELKAAYAQLKNDGVEFVGIGLQDKPEKLRAFVQENNIDWMTLEDADGTVGDVYGVPGMPVSVFVDASGIARKKTYGAVTQAEILAAFAQMK